MTGTLAPFPLVRAEALPENGKYQDTGCHLFVKCLTCPRATCIFDEEDEEREGEPGPWKERGEKIRLLMRQGFSIREMAKSRSQHPHYLQDQGTYGRGLAYLNPSASVQEIGVQVTRSGRDAWASTRRAPMCQSRGAGMRLSAL